MEEVKCRYCGYIIVRPYPKDQLCPKCGRFLTELFQYKNDQKAEAKSQPKEFETKTSTLSKKYEGKVKKVKKKEKSFSIEDEFIDLSPGGNLPPPQEGASVQGDNREYVKFLGITSKERTPLFASNKRFIYLLELANNLDFIATSILGGELDKMLLTTGAETNEKCQFYVKDNLIYLVYGIFPDKKGKWILEQMAKYYSELVKNKDVDNLEKLEKSQIDFEFKRRLYYILKEYLALQDVFTDQEIPYLEDWIRIDYLGLSSMSIGVISLLLDEENNLKVEVPGQFDKPSEELEMKESLLTAKIEAIAANTLGNTGSYPRWIAVKLKFQQYRFLTFNRYQNDYFVSLLSEGNLKKIELVEEKMKPYLHHVIDTPFEGNLRPFNKLKSTLRDLIRLNSGRKFT